MQRSSRISRLLGLYAAPAARNAVPARVSLATRFYSSPAGGKPASEGAEAAEAADGKAGAAASEGGETAASAAAEGEQKSEQKSEWQQKFEKKDKEAAKLKEAYQRSLADFQNLQKTTQQEIKKSQQFALQKFAKDLIESVDNFDLAVRAYPKEKLESAPKEVQEFYNGIVMVQQVLEKTLSKHGIVKVDPINEKFDPNEHEALYQIPQEGTEPGTIIHVDRTGFKLFDRVLRAPKVGFVKDPSE